MAHGWWCEQRHRSRHRAWEGGWELGHLLAVPTSETTIKADKEHWTLLIFGHQQRTAAALRVLLLADCNGHEVGIALRRRQWVAGLDGHCTGALILDIVQCSKHFENTTRSSGSYFVCAIYPQYDGGKVPLKNGGGNGLPSSCLFC